MSALNIVRDFYDSLKTKYKNRRYDRTASFFAKEMMKIKPCTSSSILREVSNLSIVSWTKKMTSTCWKHCFQQFGAFFYIWLKTSAFIFYMWLKPSAFMQMANHLQLYGLQRNVQNHNVRTAVFNERCHYVVCGTL